MFLHVLIFTLISDKHGLNKDLTYQVGEQKFPMEKKQICVVENWKLIYHVKRLKKMQ